MTRIDEIAWKVRNGIIVVLLFSAIVFGATAFAFWPPDLVPHPIDPIEPEKYPKDVRIEMPKTPEMK